MRGDRAPAFTFVTASTKFGGGVVGVLLIFVLRDFCGLLLLLLGFLVFFFSLWAVQLCFSVPVPSLSCSTTWHLACLCFL